VLRGFLATTLRVDVPAALLRMPEDSFCEVLLGAVAQLVELLAAVDAQVDRSPPSSHHRLSSPNNPSRRRSPAGRWRSAWPAGALTAL